MYELKNECEMEKKKKIVPKLMKTSIDAQIFPVQGISLLKDELNKSLNYMYDEFEGK